MRTAVKTPLLFSEIREPGLGQVVWECQVHIWVCTSGCRAPCRAPESVLYQEDNRKQRPCPSLGADAMTTQMKPGSLILVARQDNED